ncbi:YeeE/YedE family protein [Geminicoccaceae bacterium 1502E]|nr:YeeE/YedE family protein [Geminicoccaceae bacterium 1502E]
MATVISGAAPRGRLATGPLAGALLLLAAGAWLALDAAGPRMAALFLVGGLLGATLYHASFGFTSAWRRLVVERDGRGLRAQMAMLAVAVLLFFPALAAGEIFGQPLSGNLAPLGTSVVVGAFIFGIGMQLGGGCASGTLYTAGGGSTRMLLTLAGFIAGSVVATSHLGFWFTLPSLPPVSVVTSLGLGPALLVNLALFAVIAAVAWRIDAKRGTAGPAGSSRPNLLRGPWPILWGALALAVLNFVTLLLAGRPWGVTSAFALWGAKILDALGGDVAFWDYWAAPAQTAALQASVWTDITSVMDFGIVGGALLAAILAGRFRPRLNLSRADVLTAIIGGLMLGYGARLAYGCNIGAYFSGIASGSLHGWLWLVAAFAGSWVGTRLRPVCGLPRV